ncbi:hypothetical protein [Polymorphospora rubra]|uniref:hypothetical protein n=1 Tax=Polymorphospora rubra TaxID=338584 RepID=UPI0031DF9F6A
MGYTHSRRPHDIAATLDQLAAKLRGLPDTDLPAEALVRFELAFYHDEPEADRLAAVDTLTPILTGDKPAPWCDGSRYGTPVFGSKVGAVGVQVITTTKTPTEEP